jgi:hypothetical protein
MKTQISNLRSGRKYQLLNANVDYSILAQSTSHVGHAGTNQNIVNETWDFVKKENQKNLQIILMEITINLTAKWSLSRKSVSYDSIISNDLAIKCGLKLANDMTPSIVIQDATTIMVDNGKNSYIFLCPSLIKII